MHDDRFEIFRLNGGSWRWVCAAATRREANKIARALTEEGKSVCVIVERKSGMETATKAKADFATLIWPTLRF